MDETASCLSKSMKYGGKRSVHVKKGTDKSQCLYVNPGGAAVKKKTAYKRTKDEEQKTAENSDQRTASTGLSDDPPDFSIVPKSLHFRNRRHQHKSSRVCKCSGKHDEWQGHAGKDSIYT